MFWEPEVALEPVQPLDAVQDVALVEDQVRVELSPVVRLVGLAEIATVGGLELVVATRAGDWADSLDELSTAEMV